MNELYPQTKHLRYSESCQALCVLTGFLWGSGKGALHCPAVGVVSSADATFVVDLGGANLSITANFLKTTTTTTTTTERGRVNFDATLRWFLNRSVRANERQMCRGSF